MTVYLVCGSIAGHISEVTVHQTWLVWRYMAVQRYIIAVCNQAVSPAEPSTVHPVGREVTAAAGKVVGCLASHQPCTTDAVVNPSASSMVSERGMSTSLQKCVLPFTYYY